MDDRIGQKGVPRNEVTSRGVPGPVQCELSIEIRGAKQGEYREANNQWPHRMSPPETGSDNAAVVGDIPSHSAHPGHGQQPVTTRAFVYVAFQRGLRQQAADIDC